MATRSVGGGLLVTKHGKRMSESYMTNSWQPESKVPSSQNKNGMIIYDSSTMSRDDKGDRVSRIRINGSTRQKLINMWGTTMARSRSEPQLKPCLQGRLKHRWGASLHESERQSIESLPKRSAAHATRNKKDASEQGRRWPCIRPRQLQKKVIEDWRKEADRKQRSTLRRHEEEHVERNPSWKAFISPIHNEVSGVQTQPSPGRPFNHTPMERGAQGPMGFSHVAVSLVGPKPGDQAVAEVVFRENAFKTWAYGQDRARRKGARSWTETVQEIIDLATKKGRVTLPSVAHGEMPSPPTMIQVDAPTWGNIVDQGMGQGWARVQDEERQLTPPRVMDSANRVNIERKRGGKLEALEPLHNKFRRCY
jgi:hypothetical protein